LHCFPPPPTTNSDNTLFHYEFADEKSETYGFREQDSFIKEIFKSLGFQSASIKDTDEFQNTTRAFRKTYQLRLNADLLLWNNASTQCEFKCMAEIFLRNRGHGDKYWGSKRSWDSAAGLQYPDDSE
ncbi:hypothetical protein IFR05_017488, partial [Cadophora sp. M221]